VSDTAAAENSEGKQTVSDMVVVEAGWRLADGGSRHGGGKQTVSDTRDWGWRKTAAGGL
jgi:hypothetical protein